MKRRTFMGSGLAVGIAAGLGAPAIAAPKAGRTFQILRDDSDIGTHALSAVRNGDLFEINHVLGQPRPKKPMQPVSKE